MEYRGLSLVCPACRADLRQLRGDLFDCTGCGRRFPVLHGIPDLRLWPDPYIGIEEDRAKADMLVRECAGLDFAASVELYYRRTTVVPEFQAKAFTRGLLAAPARAAHSLDRWERTTRIVPATSRLLEIGCGTAPLLIGAAPRYAAAAGIDIAFRWLIMARKRLEEAGIDLPLICACAEALPFEDGAFDAVVSDSAIEVVRDVTRALAESSRVMRAGAAFMVATPNRFSLGPDPHAGIPAGGWLPKAMVDAWVRRKGGIPPERTLLSRRSLRRVLAGAGMRDIHVFVPDIPAAQRNGFGSAARHMIDVYNRMTASAAGALLLSLIGPLLHATAVKDRATSSRAAGVDPIAESGA